MVVGNVPEAVDLLVAGAGPGGYTAALLAAERGRKVVLVDAGGEDAAGGVCLNTGCIPSKALIEAAELAHRARGGADMGVTVNGVAFDMPRFQTWKQTIVSGLNVGVRGLLRRAGVRVVRGHLRLVDQHNAVVSHGEDAAQFMEYKDLVLATGSSPTALPSLPFDGERVIDSSGALDLSALPSRVAVVGAGYIGLELGTALAKLGASVTLIEAMDRVLPAMDEALSAPVTKRLDELGVSVQTGCRVQGLSEDGAGVTVERGEQHFVVEADRIIVAVGRKPNTADLGLAEAGLDVREDGLLEPAANRLVAPHIAAIGDITPGPALAHKATAEAAVAVAALCGEQVAFEPQTIPLVVFSDPEVAVAGMSLEQAREAGVEALRTTVPLTASGRAATLSARTGFASCVHDRADGALLGVALVGPHASELIAEAVLAIEMGASLEDLALSVHPHPTLSEQIAELAHRAAPQD